MLAIDVECFMPLAQFRTLLNTYPESIRGSRKAKGTSRIYLLGEIESEKEKTSRVQGLRLSDSSVGMLNQFLEKANSSLRL